MARVWSMNVSTEFVSRRVWRCLLQAGQANNLRCLQTARWGPSQTNQGCTQLHAAAASPSRHVSPLLEPCVQTFFVVLIPSSTWLVPRLCDQLKDWSDMNLPSAGATKPPVLFNCNRWCTYKFELVLSKKPVPLEVFVFLQLLLQKGGTPVTEIFLITVGVLAPPLSISASHPVRRGIKDCHLLKVAAAVWPLR